MAAAAASDRPSDLVAPEITYHVPQAGRVQTALFRPHGPPPAAPARPPVTTPVLLLPRPDRNIDKVVLGNFCFRTWYPSYYGKEVLGDGAAPVLERLYVCPSCFKYARELVAWRGHVRLCERLARVPGRKIYVHPRGRRTTLVAPRRRRGDGGVRYVEEVVEDEGEWSIWEVDGDKDGVSRTPPVGRGGRLTDARASCSARICRSSPSSSSTTSPSSSTCRASTTSCSSTRHRRAGRRR